MQAPRALQQGLRYSTVLVLKKFDNNNNNNNDSDNGKRRNVNSTIFFTETDEAKDKGEDVRQPSDDNEYEHVSLFLVFLYFSKIRLKLFFLIFRNEKKYNQVLIT